VVNPEYSGKTLSSELIANHLYTPSYISMSTALRYYGLIPEAVYVHLSMTVKHSRSFQTPIGSYDYKYISREAFSVGVRSIHKGDYAFLMASPEKALCDLIANSSKVNLRYMKDVENYLENDIRMDMEEFMKFDPRVLEEYIKVGKKSDSIATLLKYLTR
jgi:predicted transcriptional regulator of viral defense system